MVDRSDDIIDYMAESPRLLILNKVGVGVMTEIIQQDLAESIRYIEKERAQMDDLPLLKTAGKQDLGAGITVGITNTLLNTQWGFEARTISVSSGGITTGNADGILLIDNLADFIADGVTKGALVLNLTDDGAVGTVLRVVDLNTLLLTAQMSDGNDNQFEVADVYKVWNVEQCIISGGNLVAVESDLETTMDAIFPTAFTQVVLTSSSSATLQELEAIQYASFGGGVTIDVINGVAGTSGTIGNKEQPSNNLTDAKIIAATRGFDTFYILGNITFEAIDNIDNYIISGRSAHFTTLTITNGCSTANTIFKSVKLQGVLNGLVSIMDYCHIVNLTGLSGMVHNSVLEGNIVLSGSGIVHFFDCHSGVPGTDTPEIDFDGSGVGLGVRGYNGGILMKNKSGGESVSIDLVSGQVKIESSVTAGDIILRGVGKLTYNNGTATVTNLLINKEQHDKIKNAISALY